MLSFSFKKFYPDESFDLFYRGFNLFTELRSYSLNLNLMSDVLQGFDQKLEDCFRLFWQVSEQLDILDEQRAYFEFGNELKKEETEFKNSNYIVWGFQFLSNNQIILLESLSLRNQVYIPIPYSVWEGSQSQDWPKWINFSEMIPIDERNISRSNLKLIPFSGAYLNKSMMSCLKSEDSTQTEELVFLKKDLELSDLLRIPMSEAQFKGAADIFIRERFEVLKLLKNKVSLEENIKIIDSKLKILVDEQDFKKMRSTIELKKILLAFSEWIGSDAIIDEFYLNCIRSKLDLDLPRLTFEKANYLNEKLKINSFQNYLSKKGVHKVLIADSLGGVGSGSSKIDFEIEKKLLTIGPVKREEFEGLFFVSQVEDLCRGESLTIFWENGLEEKDNTWLKVFDLFKDAERVPVVIDSDSVKTDINHLAVDEILLKGELNSISATKLQNYLDCPRKFYIQNVEKLRLEPKLKQNLAPNDKGILSHEIIEEFFNQGLSLEKPGELRRLSESLLKNYCSKNSRSLSRQNFLTTLWEIETHAKNGILYINDLHRNGFSNQKFEVPLKGKNQMFFVTGQIDCVLEDERIIGLLDFKRSASSIPSLGKIRAFEKIQLWFYFSYLLSEHQSSQKPLGFLGYVDLSEPKNSVVFLSDEFSHYKEKFQTGRVYAIEDFVGKVNEYAAFESQLLGSLSSKKSFPADPVDESVCHFCLINKLCAKTPNSKEVSHVN